MVWDGVRRRAEDHGGENPETILARIDERLKSHLDNFATHVHSNKNDFSEVRGRMELENNKIRKEILDQGIETKTDIKWLFRYAYLAMGAAAIIHIFIVPIIVQNTIKKMNKEIGMIITSDTTT